MDGLALFGDGGGEREREVGREREVKSERERKGAMESECV